jgi:DNA-binding MarR family transcriptional regulator
MVRAAQRHGRTNSRGSTKGTPEVLKLTRRVMTLFRERLDERLRPLEVTTAQLKVLAALTHEPGTSGAQISRFCEVTPQTTHALLAAAEKRGWVVRSPDPENAHTLLATLTPQGKRIFVRGRTIARKLQTRMLGTLTAVERGQLEILLSQLIANLG